MTKAMWIGGVAAAVVLARRAPRASARARPRADAHGEAATVGGGDSQPLR